MAVRAAFGSTGKAWFTLGNGQIVVLISRAVSKQLSRREFLKLMAIGVGALVFVSPRRVTAERAVATRTDEFWAWGQDSFPFAALMRPYQGLSDWPVEPSWSVRGNTPDQRGTP